MKVVREYARATRDEYDRLVRINVLLKLFDLPFEAFLTSRYPNDRPDQPFRLRYCGRCPMERAEAPKWNFRSLAALERHANCLMKETLLET